jgi:hypothetical protein
MAVEISPGPHLLAHSGSRAQFCDRMLYISRTSQPQFKQGQNVSNDIPPLSPMAEEEKNRRHKCYALLNLASELVCNSCLKSRAKDRFLAARTGGGATIPLKVSDAAVINDSKDDQNRTSTCSC